MEVLELIFYNTTKITHLYRTLFDYDFILQTLMIFSSNCAVTFLFVNSVLYFLSFLFVNFVVSFVVKMNIISFLRDAKP